ncbi:3-beta-hydroxycholanate 3-dehydrogenase (NAD(+)) 2 [Colletotrichum sidae]|uniref:3-beta-hydroxycholanate 3-dehydrogenase (NAD(+)) 2 n=2 Tax=Colletotrichum orbiculare species complex TaxID=2707354 RepID=A0A4R8QNQ0_COLTR|nr:3-beta-hydroxycholanate 3-dehydrogenase (NAD(+)) 2 [Colletotrichum trifolii]TEA14976.1 3-beta-hydroxycholanate 3-dehydrogenase (NAD(+)) 2 [Colletotrichum sidae]
MGTHTGTTVIVTGSGGGLGKFIAEAYLAAGANVVISDINQSRIDATVAEHRDTYAGRVHAVAADVSSEPSVANLVSATVERFGRLDVLVNNAGVMDRFDPAGECSKDTWDSVLAVNLTGPFLTTRAAVNQFLAQGARSGYGGPPGLIINIGSNASTRGFSAGVAYTASKHGLVAVTKNTAGFYGDKGIYSVALLLGGMDTTNIMDAFAQGINETGMARTTAALPEYKRGETGLDPAAVAKYCVFLTDKDIAEHANGSCVTFNKNWPYA